MNGQTAKYIITHITTAGAKIIALFYKDEGSFIHYQLKNKAVLTFIRV